MSVQHVMYTSNPIHDYEFSWTIEHFSLSPDLITGPSVSPIPGFLEKFYLRLEYYCNTRASPKFLHSLHVYVLGTNVKKSSLVVSGYVTIRKTDGTLVKQKTISDELFKEGIISSALSLKVESTSNSKRKLSQEMNLLEDKLVVKGKLSISGYDIASSVSSLIDKSGSAASEKLVEDFKTMYESGSTSDITFSVDEKTLRAHKNILISRSPVFATMFESDMSESNSNEVVIKDADLHAFNSFLVFLYTGAVEDKKWDTVLSLYSLAHKYQVNSLHAVCSGILGNSLTTDSVCSVLVLSDLHADQELKDVAKGFIRGHFIEIAGTTEWADIILTKPHFVKEILASMASQRAIK